jgi:hypothetical protein
MPRIVNDVDTLKLYLSRVMQRADHHAKDVELIAPAIIGYIIWKKDEDAIEVHEQQEDMKNVMRVKINGTKYVFTYDHTTRTIQIKDKLRNGTTFHSISNLTTLAQLKRIFELL